MVHETIGLRTFFKFKRQRTSGADLLAFNLFKVKHDYACLLESRNWQNSRTLNRPFSYLLDGATNMTWQAWEKVEKDEIYGWLYAKLLRKSISTIEAAVCLVSKNTSFYAIFITSRCFNWSFCYLWPNVDLSFRVTALGFNPVCFSQKVTLSNTLRLHRHLYAFWFE